MTIDEAIRHATGVAERCCGTCAAEHRQLSEWLTELKVRRACSTVEYSAAWQAGGKQKLGGEK